MVQCVCVVALIASAVPAREVLVATRLQATRPRCDECSLSVGVHRQVYGSGQVFAPRQALLLVSGPDHRRYRPCVTRPS